METKSEPQTSGMADFILDKQDHKRVKECKCISDIRGKYLKRNGKRKVWKKYVTSTDKPLKSYWLKENNSKKYLENLVTKEGEV